MPGCFGFHGLPPMCPAAKCGKLLRGAEDTPAPPPYYHRVYPLSRTAGWTLGTKWETRVPIYNAHAAPTSWVEVLRYRIKIHEGEAGYGFWFNRVPGSGVWLNVGRTCRLLGLPKPANASSTGWIDQVVATCHQPPRVTGGRREHSHHRGRASVSCRGYISATSR